MKCPRCGMENKEDDKICKYCGALLPEKAAESNYSAVPPRTQQLRRRRTPSKFERAVSAILHALLYVMLFYGVQILVTTAYEAAYMLSLGVTVLDEATAKLIIEKVTDNQVLILLVSNLITILISCMVQTLRKRSVKRELGLSGVNIMRAPTFLLFGIVLNLFVSCTISILPISGDVVQSFDTHYSSLFGGDSLLLQIMSVAVVARYC